MFSRPHLLMLTTAAIVATLTLSWSVADEPERPLIDILQSAASPAEKAITCKRLAVCGTGEAVPALASLLSDPQLASWARIALEVIPDPAADAALRDALGRLDGSLRIGVIHSIGVRRDGAAVEGLTTQLRGADAEVASAAAVALGKIANDAAIQVLRQSLATTSGSVRSAVAEGCILGAEQLSAQHKDAEAAALYDAVRQADVPRQRILEATRGAVLARRSAGVPLLVELLRSPDKRIFNMGLTTARELPGGEVTAAVVAELDGATPERQALLIHVLADRGDVQALPAVLQMAQRGAAEARLAALIAVRRLGNVSCVPVLLEIAAEAPAEVAEAAQTTLAALPGKDVDHDLMARLHHAEGSVRRVLIELAGRRRLAAVPLLLLAADDRDARVRAAALIALGETVGPDNLDVLLQRVVASTLPSDISVAQQALCAACLRMPDREACAEQLGAAMSQASPSAQDSLLRILSSIGGARALQTVAAAAQGSPPGLQDTATQLLGAWMAVDAAPVLLDVARTAGEEKYRIRALRGYIRLARQFSMTAAERAAMCRTAFRTAQRDAERKLVLDVLQRYPGSDTLELAVEAARIPSLKHEATATAHAIAQEIGATDDLQRLLEQSRVTDERVEADDELR